MADAVFLARAVLSTGGRALRFSGGAPCSMHASSEAAMCPLVRRGIFGRSSPFEEAVCVSPPPREDEEVIIGRFLNP